MVCVDNHVDIKITATGAQIAAYTRTEEKIYYNKKDNELNPNGATKNKKFRDTDRNDVSRLHSVPQRGFEPPTPALGEPCSIP